MPHHSEAAPKDKATSHLSAQKATTLAPVVGSLVPPKLLLRDLKRHVKGYRLPAIPNLLKDTKARLGRQQHRSPGKPGAVTPRCPWLARRSRYAAMAATLNWEKRAWNPTHG